MVRKDGGKRTLDLLVADIDAAERQAREPVSPDKLSIGDVCEGVFYEFNREKFKVLVTKALTKAGITNATEKN